MRACKTRLRLDGPDLDLTVFAGDHLGRVRLALQAGAAQELHSRVDAGHAFAEQRRLLEELHHLVAVSRAQRGGPALVLLEQAREALPARFGELEALAVAVEYLELLPLVREQDLLEL